MSAEQGAAGSWLSAQCPLCHTDDQQVQTVEKSKAPSLSALHSFPLSAAAPETLHGAARGLRNHDSAVTIVVIAFIHSGRISCSSRLPQVESRLYPLQPDLKAKA